MKKVLLALGLTFMFIAVSSCGAKKVKGDKPVEQIVPKTAAEAREIARSRRFSDVPDTVFLDYYLGMSEKEVNALTKKYLSEKKFKKDRYFDFIHYPIEIVEYGQLDPMVDFDFENDSLMRVSLTFHSYVKASTLNDNFFSTFLNKGYVFYYVDENPDFHVPSYEYFKGNTSINIMTCNGITVLQFVDEEFLSRIQAKNEAAAAAEKERKQREAQERVNQSLSDF